MSSKVQTKFAVREMKVMEDNLKKLGYTYSKNQNGTLSIDRRYHKIEISENSVDYDSDDASIANKIKFGYTKELAIRDTEERGEIYEIEETSDEITILVG